MVRGRIFFQVFCIGVTGETFSFPSLSPFSQKEVKPIAVESLTLSDETRAERDAKETCCGQWIEIQFFSGF
jgi:hypothetical protein